MAKNKKGKKRKRERARARRHVEDKPEVSVPMEPVSSDDEKLESDMADQSVSTASVQCTTVLHRYDAEAARKGLDIARGKGCGVAERAKLLFEWLIAPVTPEQFFAEYRDKRPLFIRRTQRESVALKGQQQQQQQQANGGGKKHKKNKKRKQKGGQEHYYSGWFDRSSIESMLSKHEIKYSQDINITKYEKGVRKTFDPETPASPKEVWSFFEHGCSVRVLCPQRFDDDMSRMLQLVEEYCGCGAGANVYLTPKGTQGFAPHYDDIDALILQVEGAKRWRLYPFRDEAEKLDRFSSPNFDQDAIGTPIFDEVLYPGDFLYFPKGMIHQAVSTAKHHSLHITVSMGQVNSWHDLLELALPQALGLASQRDSSLRESLPRNYMDYMGVIHSDKEDPRRAAFMQRMAQAAQSVLAFLPFDASADQMVKRFLHARQPPLLDKKEQAKVDAIRASASSSSSSSSSSNRAGLSLHSRIRLRSKDVCRLVVEEDEARLYHCMGNSRVFHDKPEQYLVYPLDCAVAIEEIVLAFPKYVALKDLTLPSDDDRLDLAEDLLSEAIVVLSKKTSA